MNFQQHVECFKRLLDNLHVAGLLKKDCCGALCDKYHLAIIFQFFMRADLSEEDYTPRNFFLALTLSHDLYDESKVLKHIIMSYYLSRHDGINNKSKEAFHWDKLALFKKMQFKGLVQKKICQKLFQLLSHKALGKRRKDRHTGYLNYKELCEKCHCPITKSFSSTKSVSSDSVSSGQNKTPCNVEDVSTIIHTEPPNPKKLKKTHTESSTNQFFRFSEPQLFAVEENSVTSSC